MNTATQKRRPPSDLKRLADIELEGGHVFRCPHCEREQPFDRLAMMAAGPPECCGEGMVLVTPPASEEGR